VLDGRFGPYVTDGTVNATVPRGVNPEEIDLEQGVELLREREARGLPEKKPRKATKSTKKSGTKKSGTRKKAPPRTTTRVVKKGTSKRAKAATKKKTGVPDDGAAKSGEIPVPTDSQSSGDPLA
jgi:DNA topoisomerase-1